MTERPIAVVTGVGPGTGSAIVRRFARGGFRVIALARSPDRIQALERELPTVHAMVCDVSDETLASPQPGALGLVVPCGASAVRGKMVRCKTSFLLPISSGTLGAGVGADIISPRMHSHRIKRPNFSPMATASVLLRAPSFASSVPT
jgi:hypothetical protein